MLITTDIQCNILYTKQAKIFGPTRKKLENGENLVQRNFMIFTP